MPRLVPKRAAVREGFSPSSPGACWDRDGSSGISGERKAMRLRSSYYAVPNGYFSLALTRAEAYQRRATSRVSKGPAGLTLRKAVGVVGIAEKMEPAFLVARWKAYNIAQRKPVVVSG